jgi:hypothetical protein
MLEWVYALVHLVRNVLLLQLTRNVSKMLRGGAVREALRADIRSIRPEDLMGRCIFNAVRWKGIVVEMILKLVRAGRVL